MTPEEQELLEKMRIRRRELVQKKDWYGALEVIDISLSIQATFDRYYNKGIIFIQLSQYDLAIECFIKALEIKPNFEKAKQGIKKAKELQHQLTLEKSNAYYEDVQTFNMQQETISFANEVEGGDKSLPKKASETGKMNQLPPLPETEEGKLYYEKNRNRNIQVYHQETMDDPNISDPENNNDIDE